MKPHKHAEIIKAWADGAVIERLWNGTHEKAWLIDNQPMWEEWEEYRIKPEPKPDVVLYANCSKCLPHIKNQFYADLTFAYSSLPTNDNPANLKLTFDGETGELKSTEVLK